MDNNFLILCSFKVIIRNNWKVLPMPVKLISAVQLHIKYNGIVFTNKDGQIINDTNNPEMDINKHGTLEITGVENFNISNNWENDTTKETKIPHVFKRKWVRSIKARGCAYGRSQSEYTTKSETGTLTVSLETLGWHAPLMKMKEM